MRIQEMNKAQLTAMLAEETAACAAFKSKGLQLNMTRGKPCAEQLDCSRALVGGLEGFKDAAGEDVRNYGGLTGIPEAKRLFGEIFGIDPGQVIIGGSASLNLMYDMVCRAYTHGALPGLTPWCRLEKAKFLCPAPGYDRHFAITEYFGLEMVTVPMTSTGPDMDLVETLVKDPAVKGIWCVPMYSNPEGVTYSDETVARLAKMDAAAPDFRIFWDNAYGLHHLDPTDRDHLANIYQACQAAGHEDRVYMFASFSKITMAGAGIAAMAMSPANYAWTEKQLALQTICYDKVNQLRHCRFLPDLAAVEALMAKHGAILKPKFQLVLDMLDQEIAPLGIATWNRPKGGYFIGVNAMPGTARRIVALCKEAGMVLTGAGATFPYGKDPEDSSIRIAPSFPPLNELGQAMELFCHAVKLATVEKLLG